MFASKERQTSRQSPEDVSSRYLLTISRKLGTVTWALDRRSDLLTVKGNGFLFEHSATSLTLVANLC